MEGLPVDLTDQLRHAILMWRTSKGLTQEAAADLVGAKRAAFATYETGYVKKIPAQVLARMRANGLGVVTLGNASMVSESNSAADYGRRVYIRSWRGAMAASQEDESEFESEEDRPVPAFVVGHDPRPGKHEFVRVSGRSMEPRVRRGDSVVIYLDTVLQPNTIVLATSPDGKVYLKILREGDNGRWELHSHIKDGLTFTNLSDWRIHGYAVAVLIADAPTQGANIEYRDGSPLRVFR